MMSDFLDRIYLDANILIAAGWPRLSADLRNVTHMARPMKKQIVLCEVVRLELQHHWVEGYDSIAAEHERSRDSLTSKRRMLPKIVRTFPTLQWILPVRGRSHRDN